MVAFRITLLPLLASALLPGVLGVCPCKFTGKLLTADVYDNFPVKKPADCTANDKAGPNCTDYPGKYNTSTAVKLYGSNCAVWDQAPGTPWSSYCPSGSDWSHNDYNWCQQPWCYVDKECPDALPSTVFKGSEVAYYSYLSCGAKSDCYTDIAWEVNYTWPKDCPYDPTGEKTYKVHKGGDCACKFQEKTMTKSVLENHPIKKPAGCVKGDADKDKACKDWPGKYKDLDAVDYYGTTCGSWDQIPGTPWYSYCPAGSDWCHYDYNWCQQAWCYVEPTCATAVQSTVYTGSNVAYYSYNTCLNSPDCYSQIAWNATPAPPATCPFDTSDNNWHTSKQCPNGWTTTTPVKEGDDVTSGSFRAELTVLSMVVTSMLVAGM